MTGALPRRPGPSVRVRVQELRELQEEEEEETGDGTPTTAREDRVVTEEPLEVRLGWPGRPPETVWLTMRTPGHDFELAVGWATHEGLLASGALDRVAYCTERDLSPEQEFNVVTLTLLGEPTRRPGARQPQAATANSACGVCGKESVQAALATPAGHRWTGDLPSPSVLRGLPGALRERQSLFARTGGSHAAGIFDATGRCLVVREDVGRHNALDKATGARVLAGEDPSAAAVAVSGRAGFELVQKAVAAGFGALVAVGAPTSLSVDLAREAGLSLFGFTRADRCVQYA